ncbi:LPXTG cell wall anchor domain-containing protein [Listeria monocytogenes]|nr:LPXTG cell wall anchor domain-containing protein [Listeria monocytogenes]
MKLKQRLTKITRNTLCVLLLVGIGLWMGQGTEVQADTITQPTTINELFLDDALAEVMRSELGKTSVNEIVSQNELDGLTSLEANSKDIKSIEGIQYVNNLTNLNLEYNDLKDINALAGLTKLTELRLSENLQLSDIHSLTGLTNLNILTISSLELSNASAVSNLTNLTTLVLSSPKLSDISPVSNLTKLESLDMSDSPISDFSQVANLTNLTTLLVNKTGLKDDDLSYLNDLTKLTGLGLGSNELSDISSLPNFANLTSLHLGFNHITDVRSLSDLLPNLYYLDIAGQTVTNTPIPFQTEIKIPIINAIGIDGSLLEPLPGYTSNGGTYNSPNITWNLPNYTPEVSYVYYQQIPIGHGDVGIFQGYVYQPLQKMPTTYKVIFDVNGNESSEMVEVDNLVKEPAAPVKEGSTFTGWYDAKTDGTKWDFGTDKMPANDFTLYAQFSINQYTATFDIDGKTSKQIVDYQDLLTEPAKPIKEGYTFTGWYDAKADGNKWDFGTGKMPADNITLYAQFTKQETPPNGSGKTPEQGSGKITNQNQGGVSATATDSGKSSSSMMNLPKTGDETTALPFIFGVLCLVVAFFGFRRIQRK